MKHWKSLLLAATASIATAAMVAQAQVPGVNSTLNSVFNLVYDNSTMKPTYSSTQVFVPVVNATDVCVLSGSATKNVRVRRVILSAVTTAVQTDPVALIKRSTANSGGTASIPSITPYDSTNTLTPTVANVATAVFTNYTANPTPGTTVGVLADPDFTTGNLTTGTGSTLTYVFGAHGSPLVLRGVAQSLAVNLNGGTYASGRMSCTFEWTEE